MDKIDEPIVVARNVSLIDEQGSVNNEITTLADYLDEDCYVLLGEPGLGKSTAFVTQASREGGHYMRIADFIEEDELLAWEGQVLFLDGLDEVRNESNQGNVLVRTRVKLKKAKVSKVRISCRAYDWLGATDKEDLAALVPASPVTVLRLEPLQEEDVEDILQRNHGIEDPKTFVAKARQFDAYELLTNPETLRLLVNAVEGSQWPGTRDELYYTACQKLVQENNKRQRRIKKEQHIEPDTLLDAAGHLSAVILLSNKTGVANDAEGENAQFPVIEELSPPNRKQLDHSLNSKIFRLEGEHRLMPSHRMIAEYLASHWIGKQVDNNGLPLNRVLNLLLHIDGRTVTSLRGLYAWLSLHCQTARKTLIQNDPLTVAMYGDIKSMSRIDRKFIMACIMEEAAHNPAFRQDYYDFDFFGELAVEDLEKEIIDILKTDRRDDVGQTQVDIALSYVVHASPAPQFMVILERIVRDDSFWSRIRKQALNALLRLDFSTEKRLSLLDDIVQSKVGDSDDEIAGLLLENLYPEHIPIDNIFNYHHPLKNPSLYGHYVRFWCKYFPERTELKQLPKLLSLIIDKYDFNTKDPFERRQNNFVDIILNKCITSYGDDVDDETLFQWLSVGFDKHGHTEREKDQHESIMQWLSLRPARYKTVMQIGLSNSLKYKSPYFFIHKMENMLLGVETPKDMGLWHLDKASEAESKILIDYHIDMVMRTLLHKKGDEGLTADMVFDWANLYEPYPDWRREQAEGKNEYDQKRESERKKRTADIAPHIPKIKEGTLPVFYLDQLAGVWRGSWSNIHGETVEQRFNDYVAFGDELVEATKEGFIKLLKTEDIPDVEKIIHAAKENRRMYISYPLQMGMQWSWERAPESILKLPESIKKSAVAFYFTTFNEKTPQWLWQLIDDSPDMVADVFYLYLSTLIKAKHTHIEHIYSLDSDDAFKPLSERVVPRLLREFPVRTNAGQLKHLEILLKAGILYLDLELLNIVNDKVIKKGMSKAQKVYWYITGMLLFPEAYEKTMWDHIGKSELYLKSLTGFLNDEKMRSYSNYQLPVTTIGNLISRLSPISDFNWESKGGWVTDSMNRGNFVRGLITQLSMIANEDAKSELEKAKKAINIEPLKYVIDRALVELSVRKREADYMYQMPRDIAQILANQAPVNAKDLSTLLSDVIENVARDIRCENDDGYRAFWEFRTNKNPRWENDCRDALLTRMRPLLNKHGVICEPEGDYSKDKRADIKAFKGNSIEVPIEIKRDDNESLWHAMNTQLRDQYSIARNTKGYGIYLVLWFGGNKLPTPTDGDKKPKSREELENRLRALLDDTDKDRITIHVIDLSWPTN